MPVTIEQIIKLTALKVVLLDSPDGEVMYEGVVVPTPRGEQRSEFCLLHRGADRVNADYILILPENVEKIQWQRKPEIGIAIPPTYGGGIYRGTEAKIAQMILDQHQL
jgi:hypothetical protein|tara:strand:+ start:211 stop:534 length:324 start_codon:yes stop_codon:yes gene_type:complete